MSNEQEECVFNSKSIFNYPHLASFLYLPSLISLLQRLFLQHKKIGTSRAQSKWYMKLVQLIFHIFCVKVNLTDSASLSCNVYGDPDPDIKWLKDGILLKEDNKNIVFTNESLLILSFLPNNTGNYSCIRSNIGGVLEGSVFLDYVPVIGRYFV